MRNLNTRFEGLADRESFNASVRHIKLVVAAIDRVASKENLADVIADLIEEKALAKDDVLPVVNMILGSKFKYQAVSSNLFTCAQDIAAIQAETIQWNAVDLVAVYHHPDVGPMVINPKNPASLAKIDRLSRSELMVVWAGCFAKEAKNSELEEAARCVVDLFSGKKIKVKPFLLKGDCAYKVPKASLPAAPKAVKTPAKKAEPPKGSPAKDAKAAGSKVGILKSSSPEPEAPAPLPEMKAAVKAEMAVKPGSRMTPMYSVAVTNELFHNGNVEAWKRIIASYNAKFPNLQVLVYYDGERIVDINSLFKWGKVKHGSSIQFAVAGDEIQGVAKLQRYLAQGASPQFEAFLRGPVNAVMPLF